MKAYNTAESKSCTLIAIVSGVRLNIHEPGVMILRSNIQNSQNAGNQVKHMYSSRYQALFSDFLNRSGNEAR